MNWLLIFCFALLLSNWFGLWKMTKQVDEIQSDVREIKATVEHLRQEHDVF